MTKSTLLAVLLITASVPSFRRAGHGFTNAGSAYPADFFSEEQRAAIDAEPRLSVKEVSADAIPDGVDTTALANAHEAEKTQPQKTSAQQAEPAPDATPPAKKAPAKKA